MGNVTVMIREGDYLEFKGMMALPDTYTAWLKASEARKRNSETSFRRYDQCVTISPGEFREYLTENGRAASETQLEYCAAIVTSMSHVYPCAADQ